MYSYTLISLPFIVLSLYAIYHLRKSLTPLAKTLMIVVIVSLIFDCLLIWWGVYGYNYDKTLGLAIFGAPVEDLFYVLFATSMTIFIWEKSK